MNTEEVNTMNSGESLNDIIDRATVNAAVEAVTPATLCALGIGIASGVAAHYCMKYFLPHDMMAQLPFAGKLVIDVVVGYAAARAGGNAIGVALAKQGYKHELYEEIFGEETQRQFEDRWLK